MLIFYVLHLGAINLKMMVSKGETKQGKNG